MTTVSSVGAGVADGPEVSRSGIRRFHHRAYPTADQEVTRQFMEDLLGIPLVATWTESVRNPSGSRTDASRVLPDRMEFCHTFYELDDGSAIAYFQLAEPYHETFLIGVTNTFDDVALEMTAERQSAIHERLLEAGVSHYITDHGYVKSVYVYSSGRPDRVGSLDGGRPQRQQLLEVSRTAAGQLPGLGPVRRARQGLTTFVLLHGAFHGGWCWRYLQRELESRKYEHCSRSADGRPRCGLTGVRSGSAGRRSRTATTWYWSPIRGRGGSFPLCWISVRYGTSS